MDARRETLERIVKDLFEKNKKISIGQIQSWVMTQDTLLHDEPYFKTESHAQDLVFEVLGHGDPDDEEYAEYREFFDKHFKNARKDIISGDVVEKSGDDWQPILLYLDATKSYAKGSGLKPHIVQSHLGRWMKKKKPELLCKIAEWDQIDRISQLKTFIKIKNQDFAIFEDALKEWGANIFRRLYQDGAQNRCIILKGGQGIGKDMLIKSMLKAFGPYYAKFSTNRDEREAWSQVTSRLVLHIEEFDQTGQLPVAFLKDMITRDKVTYRAPYDRASATKKCYASFISTVNIDAVLRDETGNRRFAVFEIESIDWKYPDDWSGQFMAQFHHLYKSDYWAQPETWKSVTEGNDAFEQVDMVPEYLNLWDNRVSALTEKWGITELNYSEVEGVIADLCKQSGWRSRSVCSMLKTHKRSRHIETGTVYWSALKKILTDDRC